MPDIVARLTVNLLGNPKLVRKNEESDPIKELFVGRIVGIASSIQESVSRTTGEPVKTLIGTFEGTSVDGEVINSGKCNLPTSVLEMIAAQFDAGAETVTFGFDFIAKTHNSNIGYTYVAKPVIEAKQSDPLAMLKSEIKLALPKPTAEQKKDAEAARAKEAAKAKG